MQTDAYTLNLQTWNKVASLYQEKFMDLDLYDDTYDIFLNLIGKVNASVFEIGCGPGNITRYLLSKRPDLVIEATDISPNMVALAKENNPTANFEVMDCREIENIHSTYDAIMCGFCMPYLSREDCEKLIRDCSSLLNSGSAFYFSVIEDDYEKSGLVTNSVGDKIYLYYHEEGYLLDSLRKNNFELVSRVRKDYKQKEDETSTHLIFIATKK